MLKSQTHTTKREHYETCKRKQGLAINEKVETLQGKVSLIDSYTEYLWNTENGESSQINQISSEFREEAKCKWKQMSKPEKENFKKKIRQRKFYQQTIQKLKDVSAIISYSDDGHLFLEYNCINDILLVMKIFKEFGIFSGLKINPDKTRIVVIT